MGLMVSVTLRPRFTTGERATLIGGWVGFRAGLDTEARGKMICLCQGSNSGRPVYSQALYCLSTRQGKLHRLVRFITSSFQNMQKECRGHHSRSSVILYIKIPKMLKYSIGVHLLNFEDCAFEAKFKGF
jgi:hypothetical protein